MMIDAAEEWLPVRGWEYLYEVSSIGRVRSLDRIVETSWKGATHYAKLVQGRVLKLALNRHGYLAGNMCRDNCRQNFEAHALICEAFHGPRPEGMQVGHRDGVRTNCRQENLYWISAKENAADRERHGNGPIGERNPRAILTEADVRAIRSAASSLRSLARKYGVSRGAITGIRSRKNWKHVA